MSLKHRLESGKEGKPEGPGGLQHSKPESPGEASRERSDGGHSCPSAASGRSGPGGSGTDSPETRDLESGLHEFNGCYTVSPPASQLLQGIRLYLYQ